ncbi:hypothetical protein ACFE04_003591 [Oxalis oulophora]
MKMVKGNIERELLAKQVALDISEDEKHQLHSMLDNDDDDDDDDDDDEDTARRIYCPIVGCGFRLTSLENFEDHYNARHSACCSAKVVRGYPMYVPSLGDHVLGIVVDQKADLFRKLTRDVRGYVHKRLEIDNEPDNTNHSSLSEILEEESNKGSARKGASCSKAIMWLIRSLDFTVALLERLVIDKEQKMDEALEDSYNVTLKQWHGWISYAAFKVALKLVPDNKTFISILMGKDANYEKLQEDMQSFILLLVPILEDCHSMLIPSISESYEVQGRGELQRYWRGEVDLIGEVRSLTWALFLELL